MFDQLPETRKTKSRGRGRAFGFAVGAHAFGIAGLLAAQAWAVDAIEPPAIKVVFLSAAAPPPPPPPPAARKRKKKPKDTPKPKATPKPKPKPAASEIVQPVQVAKLDEPPEAIGDEGDEGLDFGMDGGVEGGIEGGVEGGMVGGVEGGLGEDEPLRVGGDVEPPKILKQVKPRYPEVAKAARVQGIVILEAIINTEGKVENTTILRGHPLLQQAAMDAIEKWKFRPGMLNGKPVRVYFTLTVNFTLR